MWKLTMNGRMKEVILVAELLQSLSVLVKDDKLVSNVGKRATVCETVINAVT